MTERTIRNRNNRYPVTAIEERPDLSELGMAGARLSVELMLSAPEGVSDRTLRRMKEAENEALRKIASEEDRARGIQLQKTAIGAIGQLRDQGSALLLARLVERIDLDPRVTSEAIAALSEVGGSGVREVLLETLEGRSPEVRAQAALALSKVGLVADVGVLENLAEEDDSYVGEVAKGAARALRDKLDMEER